MGESDTSKTQTWRTTHGDMSDIEWELIADPVDSGWKPGLVGRPPKIDKRRIIDAIFYVTATGCQWRALPECYPNWNTVHRYHLRWSRDGTWDKIAARLTTAVRELEGREPHPSAGAIDARTVKGASTVTSATRGYDAGKKISGRKTFGVCDTLGLLITIFVVQASASDNAGGIVAVHAAKQRSTRLTKVWCDAGFKVAFAKYCASQRISAEVVNRIHPHEFVALPKRWLIERTWSWLMNNRRLQIDYERDPAVTEGFIWAAHSRHLLRRLTQTAPTT